MPHACCNKTTPDVISQSSHREGGTMGNRTLDTTIQVGQERVDVHSSSTSPCTDFISETSVIIY